MLSKIKYRLAILKALAPFAKGANRFLSESAPTPVEFGRRSDEGTAARLGC
jgi:hypothetical protein